MTNAARDGRAPIRLVLATDEAVAAEPDVSSVAALIGEAARGAMLMGLMDGRALTATELAWRAGVSAQTASAHLAKLLEGGLLAVERSGRHRYYRLASAEVARCVEALASLAPAPPRPRDRESEAARALRFARSCYDHLAGRLGVLVAEALVASGRLARDEDAFSLTDEGERWFVDFGVDPAAARRSRRPLARRCLDWSERRPHLAGALGAAMLSRMLELGWLARARSGRALRLTHDGREALRRRLGVDL